MNPENNSRPVKFEPGTLVKWTQHNDNITYIVDHNSAADLCWIHHYRFNQPIPVAERMVRGLRYHEFCWFLHPETGNWMCGKTRGYMAVIIHMFALVLIVLGIATWGDGPTWTAIVIGAAILLGFWIGTRNNYTGKWK